MWAHSFWAASMWAAPMWHPPAVVGPVSDNVWIVWMQGD